MKTQCPHCLTFFNVKPEYIGKKAKCKKCAQGFVMYEAGLAMAASIMDSAGVTVIPGRAANAASLPSTTINSGTRISREASAQLKLGTLKDAGVSPRPPAVASAAPAGAAARRTAFPSVPVPDIMPHAAPSAGSAEVGRIPFQPLSIESKKTEPAFDELDNLSASKPASDDPAMSSRAMPDFIRDASLPPRASSDQQPGLTSFSGAESMTAGAEAAAIIEVEALAAGPTVDLRWGGDLSRSPAGVDKKSPEARRGMTPIGVPNSLADMQAEPTVKGADPAQTAMPQASGLNQLPANPMLEVPATVIPPRPLNGDRKAPSPPRLMPEAEKKASQPWPPLADVPATVVPPRPLFMDNAAGSRSVREAASVPAAKAPVGKATVPAPSPPMAAFQNSTAAPRQPGNIPPQAAGVGQPPLRPLTGIRPPQPRPRALRAPGGLPKAPDVQGRGMITPQGQAVVQPHPGMLQNMPGPHISQIRVETPPPPPKRVIPTSWTAPLPVEVVIDGRPVTPVSCDGSAVYAETYASPLPLDVQHRLDDGQAITVEIYDGPLRIKNEDQAAHLIDSPIELDENLPDAAVSAESPLLIAGGDDHDFLLFGNSESPVAESADGGSCGADFFISGLNVYADVHSPISVVDRLSIDEREPLKIGAVEGQARRLPKARVAPPMRAPQFPPAGFRPPMFPRVPAAPDNLVAPEFMEEYSPQRAGTLARTVVFVFKTIYRSIKSVSIAFYWFFKRQFDKVPRPVLTSSLACLLIGLLAGAWALSIKSSGEIAELQGTVAYNQNLLKNQKNNKIENLQAERDRLREDLLRVAAISRDYPDGSIPRALAMAASEEFKIADALLLQQIAAIESGAKVTVSVKQTNPDPDLAITLEEEMGRLQSDISRQLQSAQGLVDTPRMLADTSIATQMVSMAILNRNHLIAKYGLSSPLPLQYQSNSFGSSSVGRASQAVAGSEGDEGEGEPLPGLLEELRQEVEHLRAENELLLNSDSTLYASAVNDMGLGHLNSAEGKFSRLLKMYPASKLVPKAQEGLAQVKVMAAKKEAAKKPPVQIAQPAVRHDGGYLKNETYVRISFRNVSNMMIKKLEFQVLTFDEHGYPVASKRLGMTDDNTLSASMTDNVPPGKADYGFWELSEKVRQVKVKLKEVEFYDAPVWRDEDIERWVEKESLRFVGAGGKRS